MMGSRATRPRACQESPNDPSLQPSPKQFLLEVLGRRVRAQVSAVGNSSTFQIAPIGRKYMPTRSSDQIREVGQIVPNLGIDLPARGIPAECTVNKSPAQRGRAA